MNSLRNGVGMQLHGVPDDERAMDPNGQLLPWAISYSDSSLNRKQPVEKGPFGRRSSRRASSRTKTATPGAGSIGPGGRSTTGGPGPLAGDDPAVAENLRTFDELFGKHKQAQEKQGDATMSKAGQGSLQRSSTARNATPEPQLYPSMSQNSVAANGVGTASMGPPGAQMSTTGYKEPTEIMLYGYGRDQQGAAIAAFERVAGCSIYEDYDRDQAGAIASLRAMYGTSVNTGAAPPQSLPRNKLPREALRKINTYVGGEHWIKVTFESPEAAEKIVYYSPSIVMGYEVRAERWRGVAPAADAAVPRGDGDGYERGMGGAARALPPASGPDGSGSGSSRQLDRRQQQLGPAATGADAGTAMSPARDQTLTHRPLRVPGATRVVLRPASEALLPVAPWTRQVFGGLPLVGGLFGGPVSLKPPASAVSGAVSGPMSGGTATQVSGPATSAAVPRRTDGAFDWASASLYWRVWYLVDGWLGTDVCGLKGDD